MLAGRAVAVLRGRATVGHGACRVQKRRTRTPLARRIRERALAAEGAAVAAKRSPIQAGCVNGCAASGEAACDAWPDPGSDGGLEPNPPFSTR